MVFDKSLLFEHKTMKLIKVFITPLSFLWHLLSQLGLVQVCCLVKRLLSEPPKSYNLKCNLFQENTVLIRTLITKKTPYYWLQLSTFSGTPGSAISWSMQDDSLPFWPSHALLIYDILWFYKHVIKYKKEIGIRVAVIVFCSLWVYVTTNL